MSKDKKKKPYKYIAVMPDTYSRLQALGRYGDTMDEVINILLRTYGPPKAPIGYFCNKCDLGNFWHADPNANQFRCIHCGNTTWREADP